MGSRVADAQGRQTEEVKRTGLWRQEVLARARRIEHAPVPNGNSTRVIELTEVARGAACRKGSPATWWNGTLIERAWLALHEAEAEMVSRLERRDATLWWQCATGSGLRDRTQQGAAAKSAFPPDAATASASLRAYYDQCDRLFEDTRALRNRLICLTGAGIMITGLLLAAGAVGIVRMTSGKSLAVSGIGQFLVVALFGAIGAFISGLPAMSRPVGRPSAYRTAPYQLTLKLAVGPVFALLGILALEAGFVDQARPFSGFGGAVLLWAVIFGSAQQLVTGILDHKASSLATASTNSKPPPSQTDPEYPNPRSRMYLDPALNQQHASNNKNGHHNEQSSDLTGSLQTARTTRILSARGLFRTYCGRWRAHAL